jgi:hypothetical protein
MPAPSLAGRSKGNVRKETEQGLPLRTFAESFAISAVKDPYRKDCKDTAKAAKD